MRLILVDATKPEELTLGEGYLDPKERGNITLYLFKSGVEHMQLELSAVARGTELSMNGENCKNYVGSMQQSATLYIGSDLRNRDIKLTAIYAPKGERFHIYLYATSMDVDSEDLARGVLEALRNNVKVPRDHPLLDITQMKLGKLALDYDKATETVSVFA